MQEACNLIAAGDTENFIKAFLHAVIMPLFRRLVFLFTNHGELKLRFVNGGALFGVQHFILIGQGVDLGIF